MATFDAIAFDADDTLWHNERLYLAAQAHFVELLGHYHSPEWISQRLYQTETRNLDHFGYGVKAFALSMIETALELTECRISGQDIQALIDLAKEMLSAPVELLDGAAGTVRQLATSHRLMLITKGDLLHQERKIAESGLESCFQHVEVVSHKTPDTYRRLLARYVIAPERFMMVGNSPRSDIWPVLELSGHAVYIPYPDTWLHEAAEPPPPDQPRFHQLEHLGQLPGLLDQLEQDPQPTSGR